MFRQSDQHHQAARALLQRSEDAVFVTNLLVIGEVAAMLADRHDVVVTCLKWVLENLEIDGLTVLDLPRSLEILQKHQDLPADLADASLVALRERRSTNLVASLDSDFDVYRMAKGKKLVNVFYNAFE